jgi:MAP/microtubule affinity-regulating kinase
LKRELKSKIPIPSSYSKHRPISNMKNLERGSINLMRSDTIINTDISELQINNNTYADIEKEKEKENNSIDFRGKIEDYKFVKEIGKGSYATVKSAIHKTSGKKYAIKIYEKYKLMDPAKKNAVKREIQILKKINHKNIVGLLEVIDASKQVKI